MSFKVNLILSVLCWLAKTTWGYDAFITLKDRVDLILESKFQDYETRGEKITELKNRLVSYTNKTQEKIIEFLNNTNVEYEGYWASNKIFVKNMTPDLKLSLWNKFSNIESIEKEKIFSNKFWGWDSGFNNQWDYQWNDYGYSWDWRRGIPSYRTPAAPQINHNPIPNPDCPNVYAYFPTWGLCKIEAKATWSMPGGNDGTGVVVGTIDTGVRKTHSTLSSNFYGDGGWYDPTYEIGDDPNPHDNNGHGTHTMGTIAGSYQIGVAPGAKWISCKGCQDTACYEHHLLSCMEFMICPAALQGKPCHQGPLPRVINNSWGGSTTNDAYRDVIQAWKVAGIIPIFAAGNSGPNCESLYSPADYEDVITVGAINYKNEVADFSSKSSYTSNGKIKPDVTAPGESILSASTESDSGYAILDGTSMAAPHVTGIVALMFAANPNLTFDEIRYILQKQTVTKELKIPSTKCPADVSYNFPNNAFGYGLVNAKYAVEAALALR